MKIINLKDNQLKEVIKTAVQTLQQGGLVIYPTETVYGAGVDATNQRAVDKLLSYKSRREGKPLSIAVTDSQMSELYVELNQQAKNLHQNFLPGPYTIISKSKGNLAQGVASEFGTIGVRIPQYPMVLSIVKELNKPITATSANASGKKRPYTVQDILDHLSNKQKNLIDLIIDAGELPPNEPSTVIDTTLSTPLTVRGGNDSQEKIQLISHSDEETVGIAGKFLLKYWSEVQTQGLVIGLNGELGAGKTIFAKGIGRFLKINQIITSPTYTYLKEYPYQRYQTQGTFYHVDTWKIDQPESAKLLKLESLVKPNNVVAIEWWTQVKDFLPQIKPQLIVDIKVINDNKRELLFKESR